MNNSWFKFYREFITDPKIQRLNPFHQLMYVYLLSLADDDGVVKYLDEGQLIRMIGVNEVGRGYDDGWFEAAQGAFQEFEKYQMIRKVDENTIFIKNFAKRQQSNLTGYERIKRYRFKKRETPVKIELSGSNDNRVITEVITHDNDGVITTDKNRRDKKRKDFKLVNLKDTKDASYGDNFINLILERFKGAKGYLPTDPKPRYAAYNLVRNIRAFLKKNSRTPSEDKLSQVIGLYFDWLEEQDWFDKVSNMDTIRRKFPIYQSELLKLKGNEESRSD